MAASVLATVALLATAVFAIAGRSVVEAAASRGVDRWFARGAWKAEFAQELEKVRGTERQRLRFAAYSGLFAAMRPLARYGPDRFDQEGAEELADALSDWYFSCGGGLMLTAVARDYYFALQDVLHHAKERAGWVARRGDQPEIEEFRKLISFSDAGDHLDSVAADKWPASTSAAVAEEWRCNVRKLAEDHWDELSDTARYAVLQQVSSRLRTVLTMDLESRLR